MKKLLVLLLLSLNCCSGSYARPAIAAAAKGDEYGFFSRSLPHAELEISVLQSGISQANPNVNKLTGDKCPETVQAVYHDRYLLELNQAVAGVYSKNYLLHNYPSHNFW